ncbi:MAG: hypothetical protein P4M10_08895 [Verrucomicrobiae bacterium]|nr:hypothetical protein [Verrucomicrobiae bacterium]
MAANCGSPGPAAYRTAGSSTAVAMAASPAYTFSSSRKVRGLQNVPGPGAYKVPCMFGAVPDYVMPSKSQEYTFV